MTARFSPLRVLTGLLAFGVLGVSSGTFLPMLGAVMIGGVPSAPTHDEQPRFTRVDAHGPVVWRSCDPVRVLVDPGPLGNEGFELIATRLGVVGEFAGVTFVPEIADVAPRSDWALASGMPGVPPVAVAVLHPDETDLLGDGRAGSTVANPMVGPDGTRRIVTGAVVLNASRLDEFPIRAGGGMTFANLLDHEFGHLVGLDHADSGLMFPFITEHAPAGLSDAERSLLASSAPSCLSR